MNTPRHPYARVSFDHDDACTLKPQVPVIRHRLRLHLSASGKSRLLTFSRGNGISPSPYNTALGIFQQDCVRPETLCKIEEDISLAFVQFAEDDDVGRIGLRSKLVEVSTQRSCLSHLVVFPRDVVVL